MQLCRVCFVGCDADANRLPNPANRVQRACRWGGRRRDQQTSSHRDQQGRSERGYLNPAGTEDRLQVSSAHPARWPIRICQRRSDRRNYFLLTLSALPRLSQVEEPRLQGLGEVRRWGDVSSSGDALCGGERGLNPFIGCGCGCGCEGGGASALYPRLKEGVKILSAVVFLPSILRFHDPFAFQ
jgi:hypothetical protein